MEHTDIPALHANGIIVTLRVRKDVVAIVDKERAKYSASRTAWIIQAVVEKLERMGYEID